MHQAEEQARTLLAAALAVRGYPTDLILPKLLQCLRALCQAVAPEIENQDERARFLGAVASPDASAAPGPGLVFHARRAAAGTLICHLALRALTEVTVIGIRPGLLAAVQRAAE